MSIKNSLRLCLVLVAALPLVFLTFFTYLISYYKYIELAHNSAIELATTYGDGFNAQLNTQIAQIEGLSTTATIQSYLLESYNGSYRGEHSAYYDTVKESLQKLALLDENSSYYIYDVNGYLVSSSVEGARGDWGEYMTVMVDDISSTTLMPSSNINKDNNSIELITPVKVKNTIVGLIRCNLNADYFGAFIPQEGTAFILTDNGQYLFSSEGFSKHPSLEQEANDLFKSETAFANNESGYFNTTSYSVLNIYGYHILSDINGIYIIKQDGSRYQQILTTLPIILVITLIIILSLSLYISYVLAKKYTDPILDLKEHMTDAANGNLASHCEVNRSDEFGDLANNFNAMMAIISNNYTELNDSKKALEENEIKLKENYEHIEQLAYHDVLTGLYNRTAFLKYSHEIFHKDGSMLTKHAIFFIDLDNFKNVNDTLGHDYGDLLLKQVSAKLESYASADDIVARTGGDEFLIMKNYYQDKKDLENFAQNLVNIVREPFDLDGEPAHVSMSIGISCFPENGLAISELVKNADIAMYSAKTSGKNAYRFFNSNMEDDFNRKNDIQDLLSSVIERKEVFLQYQPQVSFETGRIIGYEALIRINSDAFGFISPSEFIPIAEECGAISQLGEWALYEACSFNQALINSGYDPLKVSVNVSTKQLKDNNLIEIVKSIPDRTGMSLKHLEIEITESVLMNALEHNLSVINAFKALGITIALDDFGTGYSSFNYLTQLPIDTLKMDKSFIDGICKNEKDKCIADAIIDLAHNLNVEVVAEGVEDKKQFALLREKSCDILQGYYFSRPLSSSDFIKRLEQNVKDTPNA